ncbi:winged helix-turn-helix transcriptional regulator [Adhaeribacter swui]|uniref:Winged helix-turn-helix transcriptional regulator n=1 Tax=Adhaeribacter swui TaxID=2086471 RepID=A0A7G7G8T7_9BACT|nr:metalloregulator ArsR/SmtB family transcription factor [Adhaeribacter swui]QNF33571.1 winged helix-turn-helix transcriptional regulator [Adhaeribacter swui]
MSTSKAAAFGQNEVTLAAYAKALAHPARIAILRMLHQKQICICGDIVEELPLSQSTVSQHLKELKLAGLITGEVNGACVCYYLNGEQMQKVRELFSQFLNALTPEE